MIYVRGNKRDYDTWEAQGNTGWSYKNVLPYFLKSEDNRNPYLARTPYHKDNGYLTVQEAPWKSPLAVSFLQGGRQLGYQVRDINGEEQTGFMIAQGIRSIHQKLFLYVKINNFRYYTTWIEMFNSQGIPASSW